MESTGMILALVKASLLVKTRERTYRIIDPMVKEAMASEVDGNQRGP